MHAADTVRGASGSPVEQHGMICAVGEFPALLFLNAETLGEVMEMPTPWAINPTSAAAVITPSGDSDLLKNVGVAFGESSRYGPESLWYQHPASIFVLDFANFAQGKKQHQYRPWQHEQYPYGSYGHKGAHQVLWKAAKLGKYRINNIDDVDCGVSSSSGLLPRPIIVACQRYEAFCFDGNTGETLWSASELGLHQVARRVRCVTRWNQVIVASRVTASQGGGLDDYTCLLYDLSRDREPPIQAFEGHTDDILGLDYCCSAPDPEDDSIRGNHRGEVDLIVTASLDKSALLFSKKDGRKPVTKFRLSEKGGPVVAVPESQLVVCGLEKGYIEVFDIRGGRGGGSEDGFGLIRRFQPHQIKERGHDRYSRVTSLSRYMGMDDAFCSTANDGLVTVWRSTGKFVLRKNTGYSLTSHCCVGKMEMDASQLDEAERIFYLCEIGRFTCVARIGHRLRMGTFLSLSGKL